jgi:hypothetical protein
VGLPVSLILIAVGAVLAFAVHTSSDAPVNVHVVGWILMGVGLVGLLLALLWWERWGPGYWTARRAQAYGAPRAGGYGRGYPPRRAVLEEEEVAPPPPDARPPP